jgi:spermidine/putrescine transport system substrate-binding protein
VVFYRPRTSVLKIYNWEDYIDEDLIAEFEEFYREQTDDKKFKVKYETFTDNEELLTKLETQKRDYDLVFPSDYMVEKLIKKDLITTIDTTKIENYNTTNLDSAILTKAAAYAKITDDDTGSEKLYAVPYIYGTLGIMYDEDEMTADDIIALQNAGWSALWGGENGGLLQYKGKITMKKSARDTIGIAMLYANRSDPNFSGNISDILNMQGNYTLDMARTVLEAQITKMKPTYENDEGKSIFANPDDHSLAFGLYWSCDAGLAMADNPKLKYFVPTEGTNFWVDNFALPKYGKNTDAAYAFINFMLDHDNAIKNMEYVGSASAIALSSQEKADLEDGTIFPSLSNGAVMRDFASDEIESNVNALMIEIMGKSASLDDGGNSLLWLWLTLAGIGAIALGFGAYFLLTHHRRQA